MLIDYVQVVAGIIALYIGGEGIVRVAIQISQRIGISRLAIGLTVVALGTSLPELFVSINSVITGSPEIAIANIFGSNIINIGLILALSIIIRPMIIPQRVRSFDYPYMLIAFLTITALLIMWKTIRSQITISIITVDGIGMLSGLALFLFFTLRASKKSTKQSAPIAKQKNSHPVALIGVGILGIAALHFGSTFLINGATGIAQQFGVSERVIALTIVAHGTSLPEIFATLAAIRKKEGELIFGNLIGSNIINSLLIFGVIGVTTTLTIQNASAFIFDIIALFIVAIVIYLLMYAHRTKIIFNRLHGIVILLCYGGYFYCVLAR